MQFRWTKSHIPATPTTWEAGREVLPWDQSRLGYTAKARWDRATKHVPVSKIKNERTSLINLLLYFGFLLTPKPNRKLILNMFADFLLNQGSHILYFKESNRVFNYLKVW